MSLTIEDFFRIRNEHPLLDVRSPHEFGAGHIRGAVNIPLLNNEERVAVGTDYKQKGQKEAINTGFRLVGPRLSQIIEEAEKTADHREVIVHCWRGGMRSANFCQFIGMSGIRSMQLNGGYKSYRQKALESFQRPFQFIIVGGATGSGKSEILTALKSQGEQIIHLEELANHKGSVFGGLMRGPQPTTEQFQNDLFEEILRLDLSRRIWIEDESIAVGKIFLPDPFWNAMRSSPVLEMDVSKDVRIQRLVKEYGPADKNEFLAAMSKVIKRLGGQHFKTARERLEADDMSATIEILLTYYDKTYKYGLSGRQDKILGTIPWTGVDPEDYAKQLISEARALGPSQVMVS